MYWIILYRAMNLNTQNEVMRAARPSLRRNKRASRFISHNRPVGVHWYEDFIRRTCFKWMFVFCAWKSPPCWS